MWQEEKDLVGCAEDSYADTSVLSIFIPPGATASVVIDTEMFWIFFCLHLSSCLPYKHLSTHSLCTQLHVNGFNLHCLFVSQLFMLTFKPYLNRHTDSGCVHAVRSYRLNHWNRDSQPYAGEDESIAINRIYNSEEP